MSKLKQTIAKSLARNGSGTFPYAPEAMRQTILSKAGLDEKAQVALVREVMRGIKMGMNAEDLHVSVVGNRVETTPVPNHTARAKARDQAINIVGINAPRANASVSTKIRVNVTMPDWAKPAKDNEIIDVSPSSSE